MSAPARRPPSIIAIERLARLAAAGSSVDRLVAAERGIVDGWRAEHIADADLRDRIVTLTNDLELGILAAEDYVAEAEGDVQRSAALQQVEALTAVRDALVRELGQPAGHLPASLQRGVGPTKGAGDEHPGHTATSLRAECERHAPPAQC